MIIKRGDIFYADLSPVIGSEQGGVRPVLIVQNDVGNKYSPTVIAAATAHSCRSCAKRCRRFVGSRERFCWERRQLASRALGVGFGGRQHSDFFCAAALAGGGALPGVAESDLACNGANKRNQRDLCRDLQ